MVVLGRPGEIAHEKKRRNRLRWRAWMIRLVSLDTGTWLLWMMGWAKPDGLREPTWWLCRTYMTVFGERRRCVWRTLDDGGFGEPR